MTPHDKSSLLALIIFLACLLPSAAFASQSQEDIDRIAVDMAYQNYLYGVNEFSYTIHSPYTDAQETLNFITGDNLPMGGFSYGGMANFNVRQIAGQHQAQVGIQITDANYLGYEKKANQAIDRQVQHILATTNNPQDRIEAAIHLVKNGSTYEYRDLGDNLRHTSYGSVIMRRAVCQGFTSHLTALLNRLGIPAITYSVLIADGQDHAITKFYFDDAWHFVDVTNMDEGHIDIFSDLPYGAKEYANPKPRNMTQTQQDAYLARYIAENGLLTPIPKTVDAATPPSPSWSQDQASRSQAAFLITQAFAIKPILSDIQFVDVYPQDPHHLAIMKMGAANLMGRGAVQFRPEDPITRAEIIAILNRVKGYDLTGAHTQSFSDLTPSHWAYQEVAYATDLGLIAGYPDGSFQPSKPITVDELEAFIARYQMR